MPMFASLIFDIVGVSKYCEQTKLKLGH